MDNPGHHQIGRQLKIYATDEACGSGLPLWLPAGAAIRAELERYIVELERLHGYAHVYTPALAKRALYERSGHWAHYRDDMYPPMCIGHEEVVLRPMNCPHHILVFAAEPRSARDLPLRIAELGTMFRHERSGVVGGLSHVRQMTLNDGHVFCAASQVEDEITTIVAMVQEAYQALSIPPPTYRLSLRGSGPKYVSDQEIWRHSEVMIRSALDRLGLAYDEVEGEAAFYGPKIDLQVGDPHGRQETLSTIQVDLHLPRRFRLWFQDGSSKEQPVMIHRSIVSTMERMVAHLLEVHKGALPPWLAPTQVVVVPLTGAARVHGKSFRDALWRSGFRVSLDDRDATLAWKVRQAQQSHVPYVAVLGEREVADGTVSIRFRTSERLDPMPVDAFQSILQEVVANRQLPLLPAKAELRRPPPGDGAMP